MADQSEKDAKAAAKAKAAGDKAYAKAARPWWKKKRFVIPLGIIVIAVLATAAGGGGDDSTDVASNDTSNTGTTSDDSADDTGADEAPAEDNAPETTGIGSPAGDGKFTFTVNSFECGETEVGEEPFAEQAQGQFCLMDVRVENTGDEAQGFSGSNQYVYSESGTEYSASTEATFANNPDGDSLFTEINPGNGVDGVIVFDVPADAEIAYAELHDSAFSGGVRVDF